MDAIDHILSLLAKGEARRYGAEAVSQQAHALQCAMLAEAAGASDSLVAACLLHDIGHLLNSDDRAAFERGEDGHHERVAEAFLAQWFMARVVFPVRWHVDAKRYLTSIEPGYYETLSSNSRRTLELQGGPYRAEQARAFEARPYAFAAMALRRWDEAAKVPGRPTPPPEHFRPYLERCLKAGVET